LPSVKPESRAAVAPLDRRTARVVALLSCVVGLVLIVGQLSAVLHGVLVPHRFCALHGLEHVRAGEPRDDLAPVGTSAGPSASGTATDEGAHDVCALAARVHERFAWAGPSAHALFAPPASARAAILSDGALCSPGRACLDYAPKIGPPA
jgi:hypothetical protein